MSSEYRSARAPARQTARFDPGLVVSTLASKCNDNMAKLSSGWYYSNTVSNSNVLLILLLDERLRNCTQPFAKLAVLLGIDLLRHRHPLVRVPPQQSLPQKLLALSSGL
jgi:hypothetical protein